MYKPKVELARLHDRKLSVKLDGVEILILPGKADLDADTLEDAFQKVVDAAVLPLDEKNEW